MSIQSAQDLAGMTRIAEIVGETLRSMHEYAKAGMSTKELDEYGNAILHSYRANAAPKKDYGFPGWNCISVNQQAAHGIPSAKVILKEGDLVNIDVSAELNGYYGDNGASFVLGNDIQELSPLVEASREILYLAIAEIKGGVSIAKVGALIEQEAQKRGFTTLKNLVGHGIGRKLHEAPREIPCFNDTNNKGTFKSGTTIALETFISTKTRYVSEQEDGWTLQASDGSFVAQHEHTLLITDTTPVILTRNNGI